MGQKTLHTGCVSKSLRALRIEHPIETSERVSVYSFSRQHVSDPPPSLAFSYSNPHLSPFSLTLTLTYSHPHFSPHSDIKLLNQTLINMQGASTAQHPGKWRQRHGMLKRQWTIITLFATTGRYGVFTGIETRWLKTFQD